MQKKKNILPQIQTNPDSIEGILLVDKPSGQTSFRLVAALRKCLGVRKIGHAGTLDPFATGVMVMLIGRNYTRLSDQFLSNDKEYEAEVKLGVTTDSYDCDGEVLSISDLVPDSEAIEKALALFQGEIEQIPPMFSAKKVNGQKLYHLARQGKTIKREACKVTVKIDLLEYTYPYLKLAITCSKGTYIRSLAYDLGQQLGCGAHLTQLKRTRSGPFCLKNCLDGTLVNGTTDKNWIQKSFLNIRDINNYCLPDTISH